MLAEKFFLMLETLESRSYPDGGPRVGQHLAAHPGQAADRQTVRPAAALTRTVGVHPATCLRSPLRWTIGLSAN